MIKFAKYEGSTALEDLGTLEILAGPKGGTKFVPKNFNNPQKRVVVVVSNGKDESAVVTCSSAVSNILRKAKEEGVEENEMLAFVNGLNVLENEQGSYFISLPTGGEVRPFTPIASLKKVTVKSKIFDPEQYAAIGL
jgi:hypothetical protein